MADSVLVIGTKKRRRMTNPSKFTPGNDRGCGRSDPSLSSLLPGAVPKFSLAILLATAVITLSEVQAQQYTFELFQVPGALFTTATDINNRGQIVGIVRVEQNMGFVKNGTAFTLIDAPGAGPLNGTVAQGINDSGQIVGTFATENGGVHSHGFVREGETLTAFDVPGSATTEALGNNNPGQIVGRFFAAQGVQIGRGFIRTGTNFTVFNAPGAQAPAGTSPYDINDRGQIVGDFLDTRGFHGFLFESNTFRVLKVPGASSTHVQCINNSGQTAGSFRDGTGSHGFIMIGDRFFQVDVPVVTNRGFDTHLLGINDLGQVVGNVSLHGVPGVLGFVATPCSGATTNCITLREVGRPPSPLVIHCPEDIVVGCSPQVSLPVTFTVTATGEGAPPTVVCLPASGSNFSVGATLVRCTASDVYGAQTNCEFRVIRLPMQFTGFLDPLRGADESGGSFLMPQLTVTVGSTLPVKFVSLCDGGPIQFGVASLVVTKYLTATAPAFPLNARSRNGSGNQFRFQNGKWQFNLDTSRTGMTPGVWRLTATLPDGSQHSTWIRVTKNRP
jgi:uncharacterized membrane protein